MKRTVAVFAALVFSTGCSSRSESDSGFGGGFFAGGGLGGSGGSGGFGGGSSATGGGSSSGGGSAGGGGSATGGGSGGGGGMDTFGPLTATEVLAPLFDNSGYSRTVQLEPTEHRLYSFPPVLSAGLQFVTTVRLVGDGSDLPDGGSQAIVETLPVSGTVAEGMTSAAAIDPSNGELVGVTLSGHNTTYEVSSLRITGGQAHFTHYPSMNAPAVQYLVSTLAPFGPGQFLAMVGNDEWTITLGNGVATWNKPNQPVSQRYPAVRLPDGSHGREVGFAEYSTTGMSGGLNYLSTVFTRALPSGTWSVLSTSGDVPPEIDYPEASIFTPWAAYDEASQTLYGGFGHQVTQFGMTQWTYGLWSVDVGTGLFTKLIDNLGPGGASFPVIVDAPNHQLIDYVQTDSIGTISVAQATAGQAGWGSTTGLLAAFQPVAAAGLSDGRVVLSSSGTLYAADPSHPVWTRFCAQPVPDPVLQGHTLSFDAKTGKLLLYGGSSAVYQVALDGSGYAAVTTTHPPPARQSESALAVDGTLYVAGGTGLNDVWALDLAQGAWRQLGTLPQNRVRPALAVVDHELWVIGGSDENGVGVPSIVAFDLTSNGSREVVADNAWPPRNGAWWAWVPLANGLAAIDSGDVVGDEVSQLWTVEATPSGGAHFTQTLPDVSDYALNGLVGAAGDRHHAWFVGPFTWALSR